MSFKITIYGTSAARPENLATTLLEGKLTPDGNAKLAATGIVVSRKYVRGVLAHKGEEYNYDVKAL